MNDAPLQPGERIVVRTPDQREFRGHLLQVSDPSSPRPTALIRLDTGWETRFPLSLVHRDSPSTHERTSS